MDFLMGLRLATLTLTETPKVKHSVIPKGSRLAMRFRRGWQTVIRLVIQKVMRKDLRSVKRFQMAKLIDLLKVKC
jgi:hypothetical protein